MKKLILIALTAFCGLSCFSQSKEAMVKFKESEETGYFTVDGSNIVVSSILEDIPGTKDEIYIKVKNFFTRNYKDANSVLQTDDKESGTLIGKGLYGKFYKCNYALNNMDWSAYHVLRVDIKENKIRVICSASDMDYVLSGKLDAGSASYSYAITEYSPFTNKRLHDKGKQTDAFFALFDRMHATIAALEKSVREGSLKVENEDW